VRLTQTPGRFQALAAWLTPVLICLLAFAYLVVGDRTTWGEWLTIWPPVGWGVLFFVRALILWLEGRRRLAFSTALLAIIFVAATTELSSTWRRGDARAARFARLRMRPLEHGLVPLRLVSWNVAGTAPLDELAVLDPDICLLQEIGGVTAAMKASPRWSGFVWFPAFDPGTLSRYPAVVLPTERVGPWTEPQLLLVSLPNGQRLLVANVRLVLPSIVVSIASFGDFGSVLRGHRERLEQFPRLAALLRSSAARVDADAIVLAGDFNTPGGMPSLAPLTSLLQDVWPSGGTGWGGTMTADMPISRIDQAWVSPGVEVVQATVRKGRSSDHRLLVVDLIVGKTAGP
jgi:endonuclease/exonuclease/phosphatase (EEP) superfamily protein YafD